MNPPFTGPELKCWREDVLDITQEELAEKLGVTREWIGKLEGLDRPISAKIHLKIEALKRELSATNEKAQDRHSSSVEDKEEPYGSGLDGVRREIRGTLERTIAAAGEDVARLGWIREQVIRHVSTPEHWKDSKYSRLHLPSQTKALSTETGKPIPPVSPDARSA